MVTAEKLRIFVSTGEVSGDVVGALLARRVLAERPDTVLFGVGGARMREAGVEVDFPTNHLGAVGITEAIAKLPAFLRAVGAIRRRVLSDRPDAAVLIGNDVFNVLLGRWLRWKGIATVSYFPPQVWIWGALGRWIARSFDLILTSFPEEERVYSRGEARTAFVGHYLCDVLRPVTPEERIEARGRLGVDAQGTVVGLLPGSRSQEVDKLAPVFLDAVRGLLDRKKEGLTFLLPVAEPLYAERIAAAVRVRGLEGAVRLVPGSHDAMRAADLLVTASGTATLEAALLGVPMVAVYRVSAITRAVVRTAIRLGLMASETFALPNLVLGRPVVPELKQGEARASSVERVAWGLIADAAAREEMRGALLAVSGQLASRETIGQVSSLVLARAAMAAGRRPAPEAVSVVPDPVKGGS